LPELIAFYEDHAQHREQFEVLAIHDDQVKSFSELDKKLVSIKKQYWQGKALPFPILLDGNAATHKLYGVDGWPTGVLIDPEGKVVDEAGVEALEAKLPPLSAQKKWQRHRDMQKNVAWSFEPAENTLDHFVATLQRWSHCLIGIDADAVKACGLTTNGPLPGVVLGSPITLRSIDELLLAPHGLGLAPSADMKTLLLTKRPPAKEAMSYAQKMRAAELKERLNGGSSGQGDESKPLELKESSLLDALKLVNREYRLPVALEARAMHTRRLDPQAKVSGRIDPGHLQSSLLQLLEPLGLTVELRQEVVLVTPKTK
jgi:hypothetical protein